MFAYYIVWVQTCRCTCTCLSHLQYLGTDLQEVLPYHTVQSLGKNCRGTCLYYTYRVWVTCRGTCLLHLQYLQRYLLITPAVFGCRLRYLPITPALFGCRLAEVLAYHTCISLVQTYRGTC
jgi:hypothetical protein